MKRLNIRHLFILLLFALPLFMLIALVTGSVNLPVFASIKSALGMTGSDDAATSYQLILFQIRLPRVLVGAIIGSILGISGASMQGLFRNPLADPSLIGVTAGASLGASIAIVLSAGLSSFWLGMSLISVSAFVGGMIAVLLVYRLATSTYGTSIATMLLAGIGISAFAGSVNSLLEFYSDNEMLRRISLWRMGGLDGVDYNSVLIAGAVALLLLIFLPKYSLALNALLLGESEAKHLGINTNRLKIQILLLVALGVGVSVALAGTIAFIGLVVPHILRLLIGPDHRFLLPASGLFGAILLVVADNLARVLVAPTELPVGLVTAFIGVPFFISLLQRRHVYGLS